MHDEYQLTDIFNPPAFEPGRCGYLPRPESPSTALRVTGVGTHSKLWGTRMPTLPKVRGIYFLDSLIRLSIYYVA